MNVIDKIEKSITAHPHQPFGLGTRFVYWCACRKVKTESKPLKASACEETTLVFDRRSLFER